MPPLSRGCHRCRSLDQHLAFVSIGLSRLPSLFLHFKAVLVPSQLEPIMDHEHLSLVYTLESTRTQNKQALMQSDAGFAFRRLGNEYFDNSGDRLLRNCCFRAQFASLCSSSSDHSLQRNAVGVATVISALSPWLADRVADRFANANAKSDTSKKLFFCSFSSFGTSETLRHSRIERCSPVCGKVSALD